MINIKNFCDKNANNYYFSLLNGLIDNIESDTWKINTDIGENCFYFEYNNVRINLLSIPTNNVFRKIVYMNIKDKNNVILINLLNTNISNKLSLKLDRLYTLVEKKVKTNLIFDVINTIQVLDKQ